MSTSCAALASSSATFPGPVFLDPSTPKGATGDKAKKAAVLAYLDARAVEIEQGLGWLKGKGDDAKYRSEEGKAVLLRLLGAMVSNEGRLMGRLVLSFHQKPTRTCSGVS